MNHCTDTSLFSYDRTPMNVWLGAIPDLWTYEWGRYRTYGRMAVDETGPMNVWLWTILDLWTYDCGRYCTYERMTVDATGPMNVWLWTILDLWTYDWGRYWTYECLTVPYFVYNWRTPSDHCSNSISLHIWWS